MPKALPADIVQLKKVYDKAEKRIIQRIMEAQAKGNSTVYLKNVRQNIAGEIAALDSFANKWAKSTVSKNFEEVAKKTYAEARKEFVGLSYGNTKAINLMAENTSGILKAANHQLGRALKDDVRQAGLEAVSESFVMGDTLKQTRENLIKKLELKGLGSVKDKNGRTIPLQAYAEMVARSTFTEANNIATTETMLELGNDLVQMTHHYASCPVCAPLEGRVYSITGKTKGYPKLDVAFSSGYANIHPNCGHTLTPYFVEYDDNAAATKKFSNRPFTNTQSDTEKKAYSNSQALKANKKAYIAMKQELGDKAPKSLSAFVKMKDTKSKKYKELKQAMPIVKKEPFKAPEPVKSQAKPTVEPTKEPEKIKPKVKPVKAPAKPVVKKEPEKPFVKQNYYDGLEAQERNEGYFRDAFYDWDNTLTDLERKGVTRYTGGTYYEMNRHLRGIEKTDSRVVGYIENATKALDKGSFDKDVYLRRGSDLKSLLGLTGNLGQREPVSVIQQNIVSWVGKEVSDAGFMSTTPFKRGGFQAVGVEYRIFAPKGTKAMYVDAISAHSGEREVIIKPGTKFVIRSIEMDSDKVYGNYIVYMDVIP